MTFVKALAHSGKHTDSSIAFLTTITVTLGNIHLLAMKEMREGKTLSGLSNFTLYQKKSYKGALTKRQLPRIRLGFFWHPSWPDFTQGHFNPIYQPLRSSRIWHKVNFKRSLTGLNSEFSFSQTSCLTKAEEPSLSYYLPIAGGRIIGFIPFPMVLVLCEMDKVTLIWEPSTSEDSWVAVTHMLDPLSIAL